MKEKQEILHDTLRCAVEMKGGKFMTPKEKGRKRRKIFCENNTQKRFRFLNILLQSSYFSPSWSIRRLHSAEWLQCSVICEYQMKYQNPWKN